MRGIPVVFGLLGVMVAGCKSAPSLVGEWTAQLQGQPVTFNFKADNTSELDIQAPGLAIKFLGTYKVDGEKFELTTTKFEAPGAPAILTTAFQKQMGKVQKGALTFTSNDDAQLTIDGQNVVLKRKK